ncbi:MAG: hypothetical protein AAB904_01975, partial [Patescibacteria group bacterium]
MMQTEKIFLFLSRFFIFAAAAVPLFWSSNFFFPYTFTKTFLFRASVELAFLFWLPLAVSPPARFYGGQQRPETGRLGAIKTLLAQFRFSRIMTVLLALFALGWVAAIFSPNFRGSFWSDYERMMGLLTYSHFIAFVAIAISVFREQRWWERVFLFSLGISGLIALYGIWQKIFLGVGRIESTFGNAAFLASYLLIHIFIALVMVMRERKINLKSVSITAVLFINFLALLFTGTRGALTGFAAGSVLFLVLLARKNGEKNDALFSFSRERVTKFSRVLLGLCAAGVVLFLFFRENL